MKNNKLKIFKEKTGFSIHGKKRFITLHAKPRWVPVGIWLKLYHLGLLNAWVKRVSPFSENLIMLDTNKGLNLYLQHLKGDTTYPLELNKASIGTGNNAPADDTADLETPVLTNIVKAIGTLTAVNTLHTEWFMTNDELPNGTYTEFAVFAGVKIYAMSLIDPSHTKGDREDTLVEYDFVAANN